ncbi:unnamed protein product [Phytophthora lilii]|uniref:Unnamed protein product n=1 Tax=Phytophthora lilii TaxID=2077276 RepID=A0A9W6U2D8_9STRA|nr:unnamed protein product [Phytophthora lilii]
MLRRHKRKRAVASEAGEDDDWGESADAIDDTMSSIQLLVNRNADGFASVGLPPLVVWHQLIPSGAEDVAILRAEDYAAEVEKYQRVFRQQLIQHPGDVAVSSKLNALTAFGRALPQLASLATVPLTDLISKIGVSGTSADEQEIQGMVGYVKILVSNQAGLT